MTVFFYLPSILRSTKLLSQFDLTIVIFSSLLFSVIKIVPELVQKTQAFIIHKTLFQNHKFYCKMKPFKLRILLLWFKQQPLDGKQLIFTGYIGVWVTQKTLIHQQIPN